MPRPDGPQWNLFYEGPNKHHDEHIIHAVAQGEDKRIGRLSWHPEGGAIQNVDVVPEYRRRGVATSMWNKAHELNDVNPDIVSPNHSQIRSRSGDAWARKVGGDLPNLLDNEFMED